MTLTTYKSFTLSIDRLLNNIILPITLNRLENLKLNVTDDLLKT